MPKRTQEELAVLQELILSNLTNVRMIILYGSYARGKYVIWDETYDERGDSNFHCVSKFLCLCFSTLLCRSLVSYLNRKYAWYFPRKYWK